jgi:hypothetical protein
VNAALICDDLETIGQIRTQDGLRPLVLFSWQREYIKAVLEHDRVAVLKSRDIGSSTVAVILYTYLAMVFGGDLVIWSYKLDSAKALFETARTFIANLPEAWQPIAKLKTDTDYHAILPNGSHLRAMEMTKNVGRSFRAKYLLASELAFWNAPRESWQAVSGSGVAGMSITAESTPNPGPEGALFESLLDNPQWFKIEQDYKGNPAHTPEWKVSKLAELDGDTARFGQEYECSLDKASTSQSVIPLQAIRDAMTRDDPEGLPVVIGVDVARFGDDRSVITIVKGHRVLPQVIIRGMDTQQLAKRVYELTLEHRAETINVDVIGVGGGVVDALQSIGCSVSGVNVAEPAWNNDKYANLKAELWFSLRQRLLDGEVSLPDDKDLERELMCSYRYNLTGKIVIQAKDDVKKALGRSPDLADSLVLAFAPRMGLVA